MCLFSEEIPKLFSSSGLTKGLNPFLLLNSFKLHLLFGSAEYAVEEYENVELFRDLRLPLFSIDCVRVELGNEMDFSKSDPEDRDGSM
ncbi:hypothetical protein AYI68_g3352 [Smittium mucronatum]|uniref:Uncharacterized protein n=1 Tax=Smittium mucronatum TaxID=133383 RepID=A0A1R0H094_9FUNG|nr:hypothetical protein AYI68_g3352 [Smittium mucronatum]